MIVSRMNCVAEHEAISMHITQSIVDTQFGSL